MRLDFETRTRGEWAVCNGRLHVSQKTLFCETTDERGVTNPRVLKLINSFFGLHMEVVKAPLCNLIH